MTMIINPTATEFRAMLREKKTFLADFYATWCGPCKMLSYVLADIEKEMGERIDIVKIDIDKEPELTEEMDITIIPGLFFIKEAKWRHNMPAFYPRKGCAQGWRSYWEQNHLWKQLLISIMI